MHSEAISCSNCGSILKESDTFCSNCGKVKILDKFHSKTIIQLFKKLLVLGFLISLLVTIFPFLLQIFFEYIFFENSSNGSTFNQFYILFSSLINLMLYFILFSLLFVYFKNSNISLQHDQIKRLLLYEFIVNGLGHGISFLIINFILKLKMKQMDIRC